MVPSEKYFSEVYGLECTRKAESTGVYYSFDDGIEKQIARVSSEVHDMLIQTTGKVIQSDEALKACGIHRIFWEPIRHSWKTQQDNSIGGRLDFVLDKKNTVKLLEYNADSAGAMLETAVIQRKWARSMHLKEGEDAGRQLEMALINRWKRMNISKDDVMHFMIDNEGEEKYNAAYMQEVASTAGYKSKLCIGLDDFQWGDDEKIYHADGECVKHVWKMWSWDTVFHSYLSNVTGGAQKTPRPKLHDILLHPDVLVMEPLWKAITTNKATLLHLPASESPHLLRCSDRRPSSWKYFQKPINGHGGNLVSVYDAQHHLIERKEGQHEESKCIYQEAADAVSLDGYYSTIGSWIVGDKFAGFGVREDTCQIISQESPFRAARISGDKAERFK